MTTRAAFAIANFRKENAMSEKVIVAGVGMIPFGKPGKSPTYDVMGVQATKLALAAP